MMSREPAAGVGTEGISTVYRPSFSSSMMKAGASASSISTRAGRTAPSRSSPETRWARRSHQLVARDLLEHHALERVFGAQPGSRAHHDPGHEADDEHDQDGDDLPELHACGDCRRNRREQRHDGGQRLRQQQDGRIDREHDEHSADEGRLGELGQAFHARSPCERCASLALSSPAVELLTRSTRARRATRGRKRPSP